MPVHIGRAATGITSCEKVVSLPYVHRQAVREGGGSGASRLAQHVNRNIYLMGYPGEHMALTLVSPTKWRGAWRAWHVGGRNKQELREVEAEKPPPQIVSKVEIRRVEHIDATC